MSNLAYAVSEVSARSPDMNDAEFAEFVEDIRTNGQLAPIWIRGEEVIDGRKRLAACQKLGIKPKIVNVDPEQDAEALSRSLNLLRTHYTPSQRALFGATRVTATNAHGAGFRDKTWVKKNPASPVSAAQAAAEVGVGKGYVKAARRLMREAAPQVVDAVRAGTLTLHAAGEISKSVPKAEQPAAVVKVVEASKGMARQTPTAKVLSGTSSRLHKAHPAKPPEQMRRAIEMITVAVDTALENAPLVTDNIRRGEWVKELSDARLKITHTLKVLES